MRLADLPPFTGDVKGWITQAIRTLTDNNLLTERAFTSYVQREQAEPFLWLGRNRIFRITVPITEAFVEGNGQTIAHGITGFGTLIKLEARFLADSVWYTTPFRLSGGGSMGIGVDGTNLISQVSGTVAFTAFEQGYATLWYTKA